MITKIKAFTEPQLKTDLPNIRPGDTVKVHQKIKEVAKKTKKRGSEKKERIQIFEGLVLARKHGKEIGATITIRKVASGVGVERVFPIHSPNIEKIEIIRRGKVRRAKLYYMRDAKGKRSRLKQIEIPESNKILTKTEIKEIIDKT
jgi:large subunit ribosomal protein L19